MCAETPESSSATSGDGNSAKSTVSGMDSPRYSPIREASRTQCELCPTEPSATSLSQGIRRGPDQRRQPPAATHRPWD